MPEGREKLIELLRQRHDFAAWRGKGEAAGSIVRGWQPSPPDLPGWQLVQTRRKEATTPPRSESLWRPAERKGEQDDTLVRVDLFELASVEAAREYVLVALTEFESGEFGRRTDLALGDVVFGFDTALLFARANLVALVRNAGRNTITVISIARALDAAIVRRSRGAAEESQ